MKTNPYLFLISLWLLKKSIGAQAKYPIISINNPQDELDIIKEASQKLDFLAFSYYQSLVVKAPEGIEDPC